jgi:hypothetical protein
MDLPAVFFSLELVGSAVRRLRKQPKELTVTGDPNHPHNIIFDIKPNPNGGTEISGGGFGQRRAYRMAPARRSSWEPRAPPSKTGENKADPTRPEVVIENSSGFRCD